MKALKKAIVRTFENRKTEIPKSFLQTAQGYQLIILEKSWPSVELMAGAQSFESCWKAFLEILEKLDAI